MSDLQPVPEGPQYTDEFAASIAGEIEQFLENLQAVSRVPADGGVVSALLLEVSGVLLTGARLGASEDFVPQKEFQPDVGPEADTDELRMRLAGLLGNVDTYSFVFDPYDPEQVDSQLSDDLASIATDLENGLRHFRRGDITEALWWWQFSYVANWGNLAGAALNALLSVISHDRLDVEVVGEEEALAAADEMLVAAIEMPERAGADRR